MSIHRILDQIRSREIVLPAIQREFVWGEEKIVTLLDSIMRGYPVGMLLLWETYTDVQHRHFAEDYRGEKRHTFHDNADHKRLRMVLDGQQRLQSLYIALFGTYHGKRLHFDVLSGEEADNSATLRYAFRFLTPDEASAENERDPSGVGATRRHWFSVDRLFATSSRERQRFRKELANELSLCEEDELRLDGNLARVIEALTKDQSVLSSTIIDDGLPHDSPDRMTDSDVLEIFVRVNRQVTTLSHADLIFSMLKLNWRESSEALPDFVERANQGNDFAIDNDFVIRSLLAVNDLGTKFNIDLLRRKANVQRLQSAFDRCCEAIGSAIDFATTECWCSSAKLLGGNHALIPLVYYLYHRSDLQVPMVAVSPLRKTVYMLGFSKALSRWTESRIWNFVNEVLRPHVGSEFDPYPLQTAMWRICYWTEVTGPGEWMLRRNKDLVLSLLQRRGHSGSMLRMNSPEIDHIFPRSILRQRGHEKHVVNDPANFWILAKGKNINKSNRHPREFFEDVSDEDLARACIDRSQLDYDQYEEFLATRRRRIVDRIVEILGVTDADFEF